MNKDARVFVAGHTGLVGSALVRALKIARFTDIITVNRNEADLTDLAETWNFFSQNKPEYVFLAAARTSTFTSLKQPVQMLLTNVQIQNNVLWSAHESKVKKLVFFGSSSMYPKDCAQPMREPMLMSGPLDPASDSYAMAKLVGLKLCQAFREQHGNNFVCVVPSNLYGTGDHYHEGCNVVPALMRRFFEAKVNGQTQLGVMGSGSVRREFLYADDLARAVMLIMDRYDDAAPINVGYGSDVSIADLAGMVADVVGLQRSLLVFDESQPVGMPVKLLDSSRIAGLGWRPAVKLEIGLKIAYADFLKHHTK